MIFIRLPSAGASVTATLKCSALAALKLDRLFVVYPGKTRYTLSERLDVLPLEDCAATLETMR